MMNTVSSSFSESINLSNVIPERRNYISQVTKIFGFARRKIYDSHGKTIKNVTIINILAVGLDLFPLLLSLSVSGRFGNETSWDVHETNRKHQRKMKKNDSNVLNFYVENRIFFFSYKSSFFRFLRKVLTTLRDYVTEVNKVTEPGLPVKKEKKIKS